MLMSKDAILFFYKMLIDHLCEKTRSTGQQRRWLAAPSWKSVGLVRVQGSDRIIIHYLFTPSKGISDPTVKLDHFLFE